MEYYLIASLGAVVFGYWNSNGIPFSNTAVQVREIGMKLSWWENMTNAVFHFIAWPAILLYLLLNQIKQ